MRQLLRLVLLALVLAAPQGLPLAAQETATGTARTDPAPGETELSFDDWDAMAVRAEAEIEKPGTADGRLEDIRGQLAQWRAAFLTAQNANAARITSVREQIAALGPAPTDGETEADDISKRRSELASQLVKLQSPGIAAEEAYRRADGLIREIDRILRERQAQELLQLWPSPINPANWPEAAIGLSDTVIQLWGDAADVWENPKARAEFLANLPLILVLVVVALALVVYIRRWVANYSERLLLHASVRGRNLWSLLASTGEVILPTLGMLALSMAYYSSGMAGDIGRLIGAALPVIGFIVFSAAWLGSRAFPRLEVDEAILPLPADRRAEGRFLAVLMGVVLSAEVLRSAAMDAQRYSDATTSVMSFPILVAGGLVLLRFGRILRKSGELGEKSYTLRLLVLLSRGLTVIGFAGPLLAAFGYVQAASALIYPAILSLALMTALFILQRLLGDLWAIVSHTEAQGRDGLVPVLAGFVMSLASLPVFALIWGARSSDITELWTRFSEGFQMGETRISPTDFMIVAVVFVIGYMLTRLLQGALRTTILPKTRMDMGGQTALVAGVGYVGIFLAALVAINAAGLDLSGLAIVAGALSVGIGFGLQTIVGNFVSGIILLVERPVSEGDWIEVGGVQGRVRAISVRATRIETFDRNSVIVPNADLITGRVTNWTRFNLSGRLIVPVSVAQGSDSRQVERILREITEAQPLAILNPPPLIAFMGYSPTQLNFEIRVILRDVNFSLEVRTDINHLIIERFAAEGIHIMPPPAAPAEPDPVKTAETLVALADLVGNERPPVGRRKPAALPDAAAKGADR